MTLREELPPRKQEPCFSRINNDLHDEISAQVEAFMRSGGRINEIPAGASGRKLDGAAVVVNDSGELVPFQVDAYEKNRKRAKRRKEEMDNTPLGMFPKVRPKKTNSNTGHKYISLLKDGKLKVNIGKKFLRTYPSADQIGQAIQDRDDYLKSIGKLYLLK